MRLGIVLLAIAQVTAACGSSAMPSSPTAAPVVSSVAVNGSTDFTSIGQTVQLTALENISNGATQNVSAAATWQALSVGATVTSGGLVTAVASGTVTIMATYQGKSGVAVVRVAPNTPSSGSMSATIDGTSWVASYVWATKIGANSAFPAGRLNILGTNGFAGQYEEVVVTVPAAVGTYASDALDAGVFGPAAPPGVEEGLSGTVTLATLTATGATGTFSFTGRVSHIAVTNGVFNVTF